VQVSSILRCDVGVGESLSKLGVLSRGLPLSLLDMLLVIGGELKNLIFPLQFAFLDGSFVFLDVGVLSFCSLYSPFLGVLWFSYGWQGFIKLKVSYMQWPLQWPA
jgi:hypothetical protein